MQIEPISSDGTIRITPICSIRSVVAQQQTGGFEQIESEIVLRPEFADYLSGLDDYSHLKVIYWLSEMTETHALHQPQSNPEVPYVGMFECR